MRFVAGRAMRRHASLDPAAPPRPAPVTLWEAAARSGVEVNGQYVTQSFHRDGWLPEVAE
jgi:hypothetical protein